MFLISKGRHDFSNDTLIQFGLVNFWSYHKVKKLQEDQQQVLMMDFRSSDLSSASSCSVPEDELVSSDQSTETTDGEDDYIAELTRQMTRDMLQDDHDKLSSSEENQDESLGSVSWPQYSTLWSPLASSYGSPEGGPSLEPTPPVTPDKARPWNSCSYADVLRKLDKLDTANDRSKSPQRISASTTKVAENAGVGLCSKQSLASDQSQDVQKFEGYYRGRSQVKIGNDQQFDPNNYQHQKKGGACGGGGYANKGGRSRSPIQFGLLPPSNQWLNPQPQSGMRAVFLGGPGTKIGPSGGTGVFLPCVIGNTSQSPKKRGCSPVLIPAKVVQALKVHFDRVGDLPRPNASDFSKQNDGLKGGRASTHSTKRRHSRGMPADMNHNEMGLPQEWTY